MHNQKRKPLVTGDRVSFKGNLWTVARESNGMVQMGRDGQRRVVKVDKVTLERAAR
jgi:hypothetical protein